MIIDSPIISGSYAASGSLNQFGDITVTGSLTVTGHITGSIDSASIAQNALTASYLSNYIPPFPYTGSAGISGSLTVTGPITAQTLIVQTITSSVDFVTGSTRFGSIATNTHQFTGSVGVTGSLTLTGSLSMNSDGTIINRTTSGEPYIFFRKDGVNRGSIYGITGGGLRIFDNNDAQILTITSSNIGVGTTNPLAPLHVTRYAGSSGTLLLEGNDNVVGLPAVTFKNNNGGTTSYVSMIAGGGVNLNGTLHVTGSSVGIGATNPGRPLEINYAGPGLRLRYNADNYMDFESDFMNQVSSGPNSWQFQFNGSSLMQISSNGNVGIGTTNPSATLQVRGPNATGIFFDAQNSGAGGAVFSRINASSFPYNQYLFNNGYVGVGASSPLSKLEVNGTIKATELDAPNRQTIIKSSGIAGTFTGTLTISVPTMSDGAGSIGYGGFSCEVYIAGYDAKYCHVWFSGYVNGGVSAAEVTILRSSGGWAANMIDNGAQGQTFIVDIPAASIVHPTARIIWNKGGSNNSAGTNGELITATWS